MDGLSMVIGTTKSGFGTGLLSCVFGFLRPKRPPMNCHKAQQNKPHNTENVKTSINVHTMHGALDGDWNNEIGIRHRFERRMYEGFVQVKHEGLLLGVFGVFPTQETACRVRAVTMPM